VSIFGGNFRYAHAPREYKVPGQPEFETKRDEIKWKLNYAKKTLAKAREIERVAKKAAVHFGYYDGNKPGHSAVKDIIGRAQDVLMDASDKMGYSYEKYWGSAVYNLTSRIYLTEHPLKQTFPWMDNSFTVQMHPVGKFAKNSL